jgi:hypothetical protein
LTARGAQAHRPAFLHPQVVLNDIETLLAE